MIKMAKKVSLLSSDILQRTGQLSDFFFNFERTWNIFSHYLIMKDIDQKMTLCIVSQTARTFLFCNFPRE
jgi:hypothetical protein